MADVTGPISSLPGSRRAPPEGMVCDNHPDRPAVSRCQGETDSMGAEFYDLCAECLAEFKAVASEPDVGRCDWCKTEGVSRHPRRDYDEGMCGPVYYVCTPCADRDNERAAAELAEHDDALSYDDGPYDDELDEYHDEPHRPVNCTVCEGGPNGHTFDCPTLPHNRHRVHQMKTTRPARVLPVVHRTPDSTNRFRVHFVSVNGARSSIILWAITPTQAATDWLVKNPGGRVLKVKRARHITGDH